MIEEIEEAAEQLQRNTEKAHFESKEKADIQLANLQCASEEKSIKDRVNVMVDLVRDESQDRKEDALNVRAYFTQIEESLEKLTKSWNVWKRLPLTEDERKDVFTREEVRKTVLDGRILAVSFISKVDPESNMENRSLNGSEPSTSDTAHLKREKMQNPKFSGDIRLFARFKANFEKIVVPTCPDK